MVKEKRYDIDGFDVITSALRQLLNQFPGLENGKDISFSYLDDKSGVSMYPSSGAIIEEERKWITGHVKQTCLYPFFIIYRAYNLSENRKADVKEWLDKLGRWIEKQTIIVNDKQYKLNEYPTLTGERKILSIERKTPGYLDGTNDNGSEDWAISILLRYSNEFDR